MEENPNDLRKVIVTDCGSTTTKALLFEKRPDRWHQTFRGESPTTVEEPVSDVTVGVVNAFSEVEELSGKKLLKTSTASELEAPLLKSDPASGDGVDMYLSTSSAGGGLQMLVAGVVHTMTTESAERAALGAGAIVMEAVSADDGRPEHERIERIRHLKPDIVLLTGGTDGGSKHHTVEMAEILRAAAPRPRFGDTLRLPVIFAGNKDSAGEVRELLRPVADVMIVDNVRPSLDRENLGPAREAIHEFFLSHVMSHSPGYGKLMKWTSRPVMPTPAAVGNVVETFAKKNSLNVLCADIGGATTDVFSVFRDRDGQMIFNRTVSANLGMSYSVANVLKEAGTESIRRWLPVNVSTREIRDRLRNKMIRPTSIPETKEDLWLEQAVCREALRLSLVHHRSLAVGLSGLKQERNIADIFTQSRSRYELVDMMKLDLVIGSGGVLSHAPSRMSAALMMMDGFNLQGVTEVAVDSIFMMPHLGVLASVSPSAAEEIFINDCLIRLGCVVTPICRSKVEPGTKLAYVSIDGAGSTDIVAGKVSFIPVKKSGNISIKVEPTNKKIDVGDGPGATVSRTVYAGECGIILDGRNNSMPAPQIDTNYTAQKNIFEALGLMS